VKFATLLGTAALLLATNAVAQDISYDYDKSADFGRMQTYAWVNGNPVGDDLNHARITSAIEQQLAAKGVRKAASVAEADMLVTYHAIVTSEASVTGNRLGISRFASARVEEVAVGSLVVDLRDARSGSVVWRGVATRDLDAKAGPEEREKNINKAVEKMFKHYPPAR
jgi:Domain of unknown function (DUF4136)